MELDIGQIIGNFRVIAKVGTGGMGAVYRAEHLLIGNPVAVKVLRSEYCENQEIVGRFFNEARAASSILHPGIVSIQDFGYYEHRNAYIVMEYIDGESLGARIEQHGTLPVNMALSVTSQIASALAAAHSKNIIHRDLKPDNIMLAADPDIAGGERIKLLDFGVAKLMSVDDSANQTRTGLVLGTPSYMAPEQCAGTNAVDGRSDLYSLGCILYKMVCGQAPFPTGSAAEVIAAHLHVPPPPPRSLVPEVPEHIENLILRLLQKNPANRFRSARDLLFAMTQLLPEGSALKQFPNVSSMAKTMPYTKAIGLPSRRSAVDMSVVDMPVEEDDEATVVDSRPPYLSPPLPAVSPPPAPALVSTSLLSPPASRSSSLSLPSLPLSSPSIPAPPPSSPRYHSANGIGTMPAPSTTISRATMSLAKSEPDESSRRWNYVASGIVAFLVVVVVSLTATLIDSNDSKDATDSKDSNHSNKKTAVPARDPAESLGQGKKQQAAQGGHTGDPDNEGSGAIAGADSSSGEHAGTEDTPATLAAAATTNKENKSRVLLKIDSRPGGAAVVRRSDRKVLGKTPFTTELAKDPRGHLELLLRVPGYRDKYVQVPLSKSSSLTVALDKVAPETRRQTTTRPAGKTRKSRSKRRRRKGPGNPYN